MSGLYIDGSGGGGGGGAVTIADGADVAEGAKADAAWTSGSGSVVSILKAIDRDILAPLPAGQNLIGNVGGKTVEVTVTPTVTTSNAYGTNYVIGGLLTFTGSFSSTGTGILQALTIGCKKVESMGFTVFVFSTNPSNTTWTDAAVANINAADIVKARGPFTPYASSALGTSTVAVVSGIGLPIQAGATSFYAVVLANAALTNQFSTTGDFFVTAHILPDA